MDETLRVEGILQIEAGGYGFILPTDEDWEIGPVVVTAFTINRYELKNGDRLKGKARPPATDEIFYSLTWLDEIHRADH